MTGPWEPVIVIGAGHAGVELAVHLRTGGYPGEIVLLDRDDHHPYERPPLSKSFLTGPERPGKIALRSAEYLAAHSIQVRSGRRITGVDRADRTVRDATGTTTGYGKLVLACGTSPRQMLVPGAGLAGIHHLTTLTEAAAVRAALMPGARLVVIGGGFIGLEVAAAARHRGLAVTVVEARTRLMKRVASEPVAAALRRRHEREGVEFVLGAVVTEFAGNDAVKSVVLSDGRRLPADSVVIGVGTQTDHGLAAAAGLRCRQGVVVDDRCRTADPDIYAIGDLAEQWSPWARQWARFESVQNAAAQARLAAASLLGRPLRAPDVPWFWSDQYDIRLKIAGTSIGADRVFLRGDPSTDSFSVGFLRSGVLVAMETVNASRDFSQAKQLIAARARIDAELAADATVALSSARHAPEPTL